MGWQVGPLPWHWSQSSSRFSLIWYLITRQTPWQFVEARIWCSLALTYAWVRIPPCACEKVASDLRLCGGFRRALQFPQCHFHNVYEIQCGKNSDDNRNSNLLIMVMDDVRYQHIILTKRTNGRLVHVGQHNEDRSLLKDIFFMFKRMQHSWS